MKKKTSKHRVSDGPPTQERRIPEGFMEAHGAARSHFRELFREIWSLRALILPFLPLFLGVLLLTFFQADLQVSITSAANRALQSVVREEFSAPAPLHPDADAVESLHDTEARDASPQQRTDTPTETRSPGILVGRWITADQPGQLAWLILVLVLGAAVLKLATIKFRAILNNRLRFRMQERLVECLDHEPGRYREHRQAGRSLTVFTQDAGQVGSGLTFGVLGQAQALLQLAIYSMAIFALNGGPLLLALLLGWSLVANSLVVKAFLGVERKWNEKTSNLRMDAQTLAVRFFDSLSPLVGLAGTPGVGRRVAEKFRESGLAGEKHQLICSMRGEIIGLVAALALPILIWIAATGRMAPGDVLQGYLLSQLLLLNVGILVSTPAMLQTFGPAVKRLTTVLNLPEPSPEPPELKTFLGNGSPPPLTVRCQNLRFQYGPTTPILLNDVSLEIPAGALVALVGKPGCGKTTLARLLAGERTLQLGRIEVEETDVSNWEQYWRRNVFGFLPDNPGWFPGTLQDNLLFGRDPATLEPVEEVLHASGIERVIQEKGGLQSSLKDPEKELSGGQRRLLGVARLLLGRQPVLIFDEPDAQLSSADIALVARAIDQGRKGRTTLLITHRPESFPTLINFYFHEGKLVDSGSHAELLQRNESYRELVSHSREEQE